MSDTVYQDLASGGTDGASATVVPVANAAERPRVLQAKPLSEFRRSAPADNYLWKDFLHLGRITLFTAVSKGGKTTLLCLLFKCLEDGEDVFCESHVRSGKVLLITEESEDGWCEYRDLYGLRDHVHGQALPFMQKPTMAQWQQLVEEIAAAVRTNGYQLVILDTMTDLSPLLDENDSQKVSQVMKPLRQISEAGAALAVVHHAGHEGSRSRGSSAFQGCVDQLVHLDLHPAGDMKSRQRRLTSRGRLTHGRVVELFIELSEDGQEYLFVNEPASVAQTLWRTITEMDFTEGPRSAVEIWRTWPAGSKPTKRSINNALKDNWESAGWIRTGGGVKNNPYRFQPPDGAENDSSL